MVPSAISFFIALSLIVGALWIYFRTWRHPAGFKDLGSNKKINYYAS
jgi:hypothetical protein